MIAFICQKILTSAPARLYLAANLLLSQEWMKLLRFKQLVMVKKLLTYITPLRITGAWLSIIAIQDYINTERLAEQGYEPVLGGLGFMILGGIALLAFALDLILSWTLNQKWNWMTQLILISIFVAIYKI